MSAAEKASFLFLEECLSKLEQSVSRMPEQ